MPSTHSPVLIVGAGPTGMVLALALARRGVAFRIVDQGAGPGEQSRAIGVHARTLEFYRQFGFADEIVAAGVIAETLHFRGRSGSGHAHEARAVSLSEMGRGISPYPYMLAYPQDDHERLLRRKLEALGVNVEWSTKVVDLEMDAGGVRAKLEKDGRAEDVTADYIAGCDGARSVVRKTLGIGFSGGTYDQLFYVADVKIGRGFDKDIYANLGSKRLVVMMPVRSSGMQRLIGLVPDALRGRQDITFDDVRGEAEQLADVQVTELNWFSTYHVHHRVADHFRVGRAFIAGDAGHVHSPTGGQGMNTGIGDAINLGWKLAHVVRGRARPDLLDTFEGERLPFAKRLVATTDRAFQGMITEGFKGELIRNWLAPSVVSTMTRFETTQHLAFRTLSQIAISYPDSPLSEGEAGIRGGQRLPWVVNDDGDNFDPLRSLDWQVHVYGEPETRLTEWCRQRGLALHRFSWSESAHSAHLQRDAAYLVRPDGYVALAAEREAAARLAAYAERLELSLGAAGPVMAKEGS